MTVQATSIRDVAALAGVSVGTVSNVLNRPALVAPVTRDKVTDAIAQLGFSDATNPRDSCGPAGAGPSDWSCSTSRTRSSPTSREAPKRSPTKGHDGHALQHRRGPAARAAAPRDARAAAGAGRPHHTGGHEEPADRSHDEAWDAGRPGGPTLEPAHPLFGGRRRRPRRPAGHESPPRHGPPKDRLRRRANDSAAGRRAAGGELPKRDMGAPGAR